MILSLDPGTEYTAWMLFQDKPISWSECSNEELLALLYDPESELREASELVVEMVASQGKAVGRETFETVYWIGRFCESWNTHDGSFHRLDRKDCKVHLCNSTRAKDGNVRQALIDLYGGDSKAIGGKRCKTCKGKKVRGREKTPCAACDATGWLYPPGPLHGIASHCWSALAVAKTFWDTKKCG
jgi:hypothetical protein